jgi:hypothetical protein
MLVGLLAARLAAAQSSALLPSPGEPHPLTLMPTQAGPPTPPLDRAAPEVTAIPDDEVSRRLAFIEARLHLQARGARLWEAGWSLVYVGGLGYGAYQIANAGDRAATAEGIVGAGKSLIGGAGLALRPLVTARSAHVLDRVPDGTVEERARRLALAEQLLRANAAETQERFAWQRHVISIGLNLVGGAIIWIAGDFRRAAQSTGIAIAAGEINIWTRPWRAAGDLRAYRREFGGLRF